MTVTATELRKLASLNLSTEQMAGVLDMLAARIESDDMRRASQAERKRKSRDKTVTVTGRSRDEVCDTANKKEIPQTPLEKTTTIDIPTGRASRGVSRGTRLPDDFIPIRAIIELGKGRGLTELEITDQLERFRDWANAATGQVGTKREWQAAFRNWIKRAADDKRKSQSRFNGRSTPGQDMRAAFDAVDEHLAGRFPATGHR